MIYDLYMGVDNSRKLIRYLDGSDMGYVGRAV